MSGKYTLVTAVLMTMAAVAWGFTLFMSMGAEVFPTMSLVVFLTFAALSAVYWVIYFRRKSNTTSGTE